MELKNDSVNKPTIAIIAQDPLSHNLCQEVEVGTPFGLHHKDSREKYPHDTKRYFEIMYDLLKDFNCQIYLTDVYKIWVKNPNDSKRRSLPEEDQKRFVQLLERELAIINPLGLITWGEKALNAINKLELKTQHIHFLHPSGQNNGRWVKIMDDSAIEGNTFKDKQINFIKESIKKQWGI